MISNHWIEVRRPHWEQLQTLVEKCGQTGMTNLSRAELRDMALLYRQVAADLSVARQDAAGANYARYLNQLLGRAHNIIYSGKKTSFSGLWRFFAVTWPQRFREMRAYVWTAAAIFLLFALGGSLLTWRNGDFALQVLGPGMIASMEKHEMWTHSIVGIKPVASSQIMTNNISVAFTTFAMGVTAGLGTLYMIAFNGLLLGVEGMACHQHAMSLGLWSFVAGHGALELPAIVVAGAAGLRIAAGMLFPGRYARQDSLRMAAAEAVELEAGTIPLLVIAGLIEGFVSPTALPVSLKFLLCAVLLAGLGAWVMQGRRTSVTAGSAL